MKNFGSFIKLESNETAKRISSAYEVTQKLIEELLVLGFKHITLRTSRLQIDIVANAVLLPAATVVNQTFALSYIRETILFALKKRRRKFSLINKNIPIFT